MAESSGNIEIKGKISSIIYSNEENGYTVLRLEMGGGALVTVTGTLPSAAPGETLRAVGAWTKHPTHGQQFKAEYAERGLPKTAEAIYAYLSGGAVRGVGPATAALIVDRFGDATLDVIEGRPGELARIKGIGPGKAEQISRDFRRKAGLRHLMEFLCAHELRPILAVKLYQYYGEASLELLRENPYILAQPNIGGTFSEADVLSLDLGMEDDSAPRICAAIAFELSHNAGNGHCFIPADKLVAATAQLISIPDDPVWEGLTVIIDEGVVVRELVSGCDACYIAPLHEAETYTAQRLKALLREELPQTIDPAGLIDRMERAYGMTYAPQQRKTIALAAECPVLVITGGPGTGKTTSIRAILGLFDEMGLETLITAPTGRAAQRMAELTGREASTVHRLLEASFAPDGDGIVWGRDESAPLECGALILDESSMVDITLMRALLAAIPPGCRLIMVGDADQLPSVGPGNVFADIIRSGIVPVVRLTDIFRQSAGSRIVRNAHMINKGEHPVFTENSGDFFFLCRRSAERIAETVAELYARRLPENMGIASEEIQVLSPTRRGEAGTFALNLRLQAAVNPAGKGKNEKEFGNVVFREGDRVMQIRNNYDIIWKRIPDSGAPAETGAGIYNGDVGYILGIDAGEETVTVDFDGRVAQYTFDQLTELEHAWAMTIHKSQGSEYRAVVLALGEGAPMLLTRGVLYTAVTRAKELLIAVGNEGTADRMIDNHRQSRRYSGLRARLCDEVGVENGAVDRNT